MKKLAIQNISRRSNHPKADSDGPPGAIPLGAGGHGTDSTGGDPDPDFPDQEYANEAKGHEDSNLYPALRKVTGIRNATGQDCFSISVLHLLAQTDLLERLEVKPDHKSCTVASCLVGE